MVAIKKNGGIKYTPNEGIEFTPPKTHVYSNTDHHIIQISQERLQLILERNIAIVEKKDAWHVPFGVIMTLLPVFVTADFRNVGLSAETWKAFFIIICILAVVSIIRSIMKRDAVLSVDEIVERIKGGS
jgi:hypothetical protein